MLDVDALELLSTRSSGDMAWALRVLVVFFEGIDGPRIDPDLAIKSTILDLSITAARADTRHVSEADRAFGALRRARISTARARQHLRFRGRWLDPGWTCNAEIPGQPYVLDEFCPTSESGRALLDDLAKHQRWTTDQRRDVLRVARTVADLDLDRDPSAPLDRECIATAAMFQPRP